MGKRVLDNSNKVRAYSIVKEIKDFLNAIEIELLNETPFKGYLNEKLKPIKTDIDCLEIIFREEEK